MEEEFDHIFRRYNSNEMSKDERHSFEQRLLADAAFKEAFDDFKVAMIAGERIQFLEAKANVGQIIQQGKKIAKTRRLNIMLVAASVLVLLFMGINFLIPDQTLSNQEMFAQFYELPAYSDRPAVDGIPSLLDQAGTAFDEKNWGVVDSLINQLSEAERSSSRVQELLGHTYLASGRPDQAIPVFRSLSERNVDLQKIESDWHLSLAFLNNTQIDSALVYLKKTEEAKVFSNTKQKAKKLNKMLQK